MKKSIVTSLALLTLAGTCYAGELTYSSYRILSDGPYIDQKNPTTVAYVITSNPPMAIWVFPGGSSTIKRIKSGILTNCAPMDSEQVTRFKQGAIKMYGLVSQMQMAIQLGKVPSAADQKFYDSARNFVTFVNEAEEMPYYQCGKP